MYHEYRTVSRNGDGDSTVDGLIEFTNLDLKRFMFEGEEECTK